MRTTVTLDSDTEQVVRDRMAAKGVSFKRALNDAIRDGAPGRVDVQFSTMTVDLGEPLVDLTHTGRVLDELDIAEYLEKQRQGR